MTPGQRESLKKLHTMALNGQLGAEHHGGCVYVANDNRRCAVGALLPPKLAKQVATSRLNYDTVVGPLMEALKISTLGGFDIEQLALLQTWHDRLMTMTPTEAEDFVDFLGWLSEQDGPVEVPHNPHDSYSYLVEFP